MTDSKVSVFLTKDITSRLNILDTYIYIYIYIC